MGNIWPVQAWQIWWYIAILASGAFVSMRVSVIWRGCTLRGAKRLYAAPCIFSKGLLHHLADRHPGVGVSDVYP
jgi:hypothetical protein